MAERERKAVESGGWQKEKLVGRKDGREKGWRRERERERMAERERKAAERGKDEGTKLRKDV